MGALSSYFLKATLELHCDKDYNLIKHLMQEVYPPETHLSVNLISLAIESHFHVLFVSFLSKEPTHLRSDHIHVQVATTSAFAHAILFQLSFDLSAN